MPERSSEQPIWGGRFAAAQDPAFARYGRSAGWDQRLAPEDVQGSIAHARSLMRAGLLPGPEARRLIAALETLQARLRAGEALGVAPQDEDVHGAVERILGRPGSFLHAGRSRNDQVAVDFHLFCQRSARELAAATRALQAAILSQARANEGVVIPGMTHLQPAQPVLLAHHLMAYFWMFERDRRRLAWAESQADRSPLGAGALAGTGLPLDTAESARELGFSAPYENSIDAVSDRDFALDLAHAATLAALHLSRLGEEIVLWSAPQFGWLELPDAFATGSSMMPQKKNPDAGELLRGRAGRVIGRFTGLLALVKGLPLAYVRDLQEDKEAVFEIVDTVAAGLEVAAGLIAAVRFTPPPIPYGDLVLATDLADHLVRLGVPFREAHRRIGAAVRKAVERGGNFTRIAPEEWREISPQFTTEVLEELLTPERAIGRRDVPGGTAPQRVRDQLAQAEALLDG